MLLFLDLETTGLDPKNDDILEIACALVDGDNRVYGAYQRLVVNGHPLKMNDYVYDMHTKNGLLDALIMAEQKNTAQVDQELRTILDNWTQELGLADFTLAGNSIHFDRSFIKHHMPCVEARLHYRMVDNSSTKIIFERAGLQTPEKRDDAHRAYADVLDSIRQYKFFQERLKR